MQDKKLIKLLNLDRHAGFALLLSIFLILAFAVLGLTVLSIIPGLDTDIWVRQLASSQALYLAESARNFSQEFHLPWGTQFSNTTHFPNTTTKTFTPGSFIISYSNRQAKTVTASFQGNVGTCKRKIQINYDGWVNVPGPFKNYVVFGYWEIVDQWLWNATSFTGDIATRGNLELGGGVNPGGSTVSKDVYALGNVKIYSGSTVYGKVYFSGTLDNNGTISGGSIKPCPALPTKPPFTATYYNQEIQKATSASPGNVNWSNKNLGGQNWYVNGTVNLSGTISGGPANIVSTGAITLASGTTIQERISLITQNAVTVNRTSSIGGGQNGAGSIVYGLYSYGLLVQGGGGSAYCQFKGSALTPPCGTRFFSTNFNDRFWGIVYATICELLSSGEFYGHFQVGQFITQGAPLQPTKIIYDSSYIPLCVKGLYGVSRSAWQETAQ